MTRYASMSRGAREAKNELKAGLFGSDKPMGWVLSQRKSVTVICLGVVSSSEMRDLESEKRFPWLQNYPEPMT